MAEHKHDAFRCPAHVNGCDCPDKATYLCNPYWVAGYCPDDLDVMPGEVK